MSNQRHHPTDRFDAPTSFLLLPSFRRPSYREIHQINVPEKLDESSVFHQWQLEGAVPLYKTINKALLNDDEKILREHVVYIYNLRMAIKHNHQPNEITAYRNLKLQPGYVQEEYKEGTTFLWPTFSSTSLDRSVASQFGNYTFEIKTSPDDNTYRVNISGYSKFPSKWLFIIHRNGYSFVNKGDDRWEEYQNNQLFASFKQV
ncbi:unnamed protein product [Didymodactylos carnosus]|uniref:ADP ribosyltransferase domain-containing protein n=1 Tax=Didymodactylos carnosus TaxID=1234261 RepID=A0A8S2DYW5_9BILA|nr:unnamed protein product [Didymodactylos carnosus]CAF3852010.1 unnamed protein product [Didymodactylos carnosus]